MPVKTPSATRATAPAKAATARIAALEKETKLLRGKLDKALARLAALERCIAVAADGSVTLTGSGNVRIAAGATLALAAAQVQIDAGSVRASGVVNCDVLQANAVIAASYTPGAGNLY
jgi:hypothetical protein